MSENAVNMRLEQFPKLKQMIESKLTDLLTLGKDPQKLRWTITVDHGAATLTLDIDVDFSSMKHPSDADAALTIDQYQELVSGQVSVSGTSVLVNPHQDTDKVRLVEDETQELMM